MPEVLEEMISESKGDSVVKQSVNPGEMLKTNYQPTSEEDLIAHTNMLCTGLQISVIISHWLIGRAINSYYRKKYGKNELKKISDQTGIRVGTLQKACKFAREYSEEQIKILLNGRFAVSWRQIAQNLTVKSNNVVDAYEGSESPEQFNNSVIKFKNSAERRGKKSKNTNTEINTESQNNDLPNSDTPEDNDTLNDICPNDNTPSALSEEACDVSNNDNNQTDDKIDERDELIAKIGSLEKALSEKGQQIMELENKVKELGAENRNLMDSLQQYEERQYADEVIASNDECSCFPDEAHA